MVKKHLIGLFIDTGNDVNNQRFRRIKKSTELTVSMNPVTNEYDYIADESPTSEVDKYQPSIDQPLTMYKDEPDFKMIFERFFKMNVGNDAHARVMLVYMFAGNKESGFLAWESDCILQISEMNAVDSTITMNITFGGTVRKGYATVVNDVPTFTEGVTEDLEKFFDIEDTSSSGDSSSSGNDDSGSGYSGSDPDPTDTTGD